MRFFRVAVAGLAAACLLGVCGSLVLPAARADATANLAFCALWFLPGFATGSAALFFAGPDFLVDDVLFAIGAESGADAAESFFFARAVGCVWAAFDCGCRFTFAIRSSPSSLARIC
jgi:hypothetical protein